MDIPETRVGTADMSVNIRKDQEYKQWRNATAATDELVLHKHI